MKVELLRADIGDAKELHAMQVRVLRRKRSGYVKKRMETEIGNWIQFRRNRKTVICMRSWDIDRQAKQKS